MSVLPDDIARLTPGARRALLARLLAAKGGAGPAAADAVSLCSQEQRSLWFMHQVAPESPMYNVTFAWRITSVVDAEAMHRAFLALTARHESLRTTYESVDGEPWQRVHPSAPDAWTARTIGPCADEPLVAILMDDARRPFNLATGPLIRPALYTRGETDHVLHVTMHHIACDLWSVELLLDDLRRLYHADVCGTPSAAAPAGAPGRYRDFAAWQRRMVESDEGQAHWEYWKQTLGRDNPRLELPGDRPRPPVQSFETSDIRFPVPDDLVEALRGLAADQHTTLFPIFLAAFQALLLRYSGQDAVMISTAASGRTRREFETIVGCFANPVVFRCDAADDPTFAELVQRARADVLAALDHQDFPFPLLVERLNIDRDPSRSPFSDAYFVWDRFRDPGKRLHADTVTDGTQLRMTWGGLELESFRLPLDVPPSDIALVGFESGRSISIAFGYTVALFDRPTIERMIAHFLQILRAVAADPAARVSRLPLCTPEEREALLRPVSTFTPVLEPGATLHRRFEHQAAARPDAVAVTCDGRSLTYRQLDDRANGLAARLQASGVTREQRVGLYLDRDLDLVVAVLAILKAGGAYLPIDRSCPAERVAFMLRDADVHVVVTTRALASTLDGLAIDRLYVDDPAPSADGAARPAPVAGGPDDLAYVIYTSGSTGRPKGVMVTHRNVLRLFDATASWCAFDHRDVWTLFHSIAFDFSVWELWGALLHGGRLVVVPYAVSRSPDAMLDLLASERVTVLNQTPSAFRQLSAADRGRGGRDRLALRFVIFGGEALDVRTLAPWFDRRGDRTPVLVNMFGITETTVHVTYRPLSRADLGRRATSPIGVVIPDLRVLVLDAAGQPVPPGVPGELFVAGAGVARGYLNRPDLDAARFLPDRTSADPSARMYRTGDLVRLDSRQELEYLGRIDQQVKIRGFRIELGEIQAVIARHPAVADCAVIVRRDDPADARLVAYVVLRPGSGAAPTDVQTAVRRALPDYMVPSAFVQLSALPLTTNGKLDAGALPAAGATETSSPRSSVAPRTDTERALAAEWRRLLRIERIGVDDDFFEAGGHSILATSLTTWIRAQFQIEFPIYAVFEAPTVAGLAARIEAIVAARPVSSGAPVPREEFEI